MELETIFVYGTLRKGMGNHHLLEGSFFLGMGKTVARYGMYILPSGIPYVKRRSERKTVIVGEVYVVDEDTLCRVDHLEGHPNFYRRRLVPVMLNSGEKIQAWMYFLTDGGRKGDFFIGGDFIYFVKVRDDRRKQLVDSYLKRLSIEEVYHGTESKQGTV